MRPERRPNLSLKEAARVALDLYGLDGTLTPLPSDRDQNFKLLSRAGEGFVLKFFHADESAEFVMAQLRVFEALKGASRRVFPRIVPTVQGLEYAWTNGAGGLRHLTWLTPFMPGTPAANLRAPSTELLQDIGAVLATLDEVLERNPQAAARREFTWSAKGAPAVIARNLRHVEGARRALVERALAIFEAHTAPLLGKLRVSLIHNDANDHNLLIEGERVSAVLDFGDMLESYTACEVAHAATYLMMDEADPLRVLLSVMRGYHHVKPLTSAELSAVHGLILLRLALSVSMSAKRRVAEPHDPYLSISEAPAYRLLERLIAGEPSRADFIAAMSDLAPGTLAP